MHGELRKQYTTNKQGLVFIERIIKLGQNLIFWLNTFLEYSGPHILCSEQHGSWCQALFKVHGVPEMESNCLEKPSKVSSHL